MSSINEQMKPAVIFTAYGDGKDDLGTCGSGPLRNASDNIIFRRKWPACEDLD